MTFRPTPAQQAFLEAALDPKVKRTIRAISRAARVHESSWRLWKRNPAFLAWYRDAWESGVAHSAWLLDKIGLEKARTDFRYWQAMQQKYSFSPPGIRHPRPASSSASLAPFDPGPRPKPMLKKREFSLAPRTQLLSPCPARAAGSGRQYRAQAGSSSVASISTATERRIKSKEMTKRRDIIGASCW